MYGTEDEEGWKKGQKGRVKGDKRYMLMMRLLYVILEARGIPCVIVNQKSLKIDMGIALTPQERTKNSQTNRKLNKIKAVNKFRELVGESFYFDTKRKFGKVDDVADAFLIAVYTKNNLEKLLKEKNEKGAKYKWTKNTKKYKNKLPPILGKRFIKTSIDFDLSSRKKQRII